MIHRIPVLFLAGFIFASNLQAQTAPGPRTDGLGDPLPKGAIARLGTLRFKHNPAANGIIDMAYFSPDGTKIVSLVLSSGSIRLWDAASGKEIPGPWTAPNQRFSAVAFSPDSKQLAAAINPGYRPPVNNPNAKNMQNTIALFDIAPAKINKSLTGQVQLVQALTFTDEGKTLIAAGDGTVRWWDVAAGKEKRSWQPLADAKAANNSVKNGQTKSFSNCAVSPDGKAIAVQAEWRNINDNRGGIIQRVGGGNTVEREVIGYNLVTEKKYWQSMSKGPTFEKTQFAFSADSRRVAVANGTDKLELRDAVNGKLIELMENKAAGKVWPGGLSLSANGSMIAMASKDSHVQVWNAKDGAMPRQFTARLAQNGPSPTACLHFSPDDKSLLLGVDSDLQIYDVETLQEKNPQEGHRGWVDQLAFTPDGKRLLTGSAGRGQSEGEYFGPNGQIYFIVTSGTRGATSSPEEAAWDVATWKRVQLTSVRTPPWPNFGSTSLTQAIYVGKNGNDRFGLFDMKSGKQIARMLMPDKQYRPGDGFFSPAGKFYVLYLNDNKNQTCERLYLAASGKLICQLQAADSNLNRGGMLMETPGDPSVNIAFSPDERFVAQFGRGDGMIRVYDTGTGKLRHTLGKKWEPDPNNFDMYNYEVSFSSDGRFLASWWSVENVIRLWDLSTGVELHQIMLEAASNNNVQRGYGQRRIVMAWSPDGRCFSLAESKIRIWELATLKIRRELVNPENAQIRALAYSPDGKYVASAGADTTVLIWDMLDADRPAPANLALDKSWQALTTPDAVQGYTAILELAAASKDSLPWIKDRLKPAERIDPKHIEGLIGKLDDGQFKIRQAATSELQKIGERALPVIDKALAGKPALETQLRLEDVRKRVTGLLLLGERLRIIRAIEVLERIGSPEARQVLQALAEGAPESLITMQSKGALARMPN